MSIDLLGIASTNAVTARPADDRAFGANDTWFKDCTASGAQDGTQLAAAWFNAITAQLRRAIRGTGVTENNADDDMLLKAIMAGGAINIVNVAATMPVHLEVLNGGLLTFTASTGSLKINTGLQFVHRGLNLYSTDAWGEVDRTFGTNSNKTYHLRWYGPGTGLATPLASYPNGRFYLHDLTDAAYNPGAIAEGSAAFDGAYDSALLARVTTNGANALTVTPLLNRALLKGSYIDSTASGAAVAPGTTVTETSSPRIGFTLNDAAGTCASRFTYNWSRTPTLSATNAVVGLSGMASDANHTQGSVNVISNKTADRYSMFLRYYTDWDQGIFSGSALAATGPYAYAYADLFA